MGEDIDPFAEAAKYFGKKKAGKDPFVEKMEESAGIKPPPSKGSSRPWADKTKSNEPAHGRYEHNSAAKPL